jgi:DNA-binding transcriptional MerR regulator
MDLLDIGEVAARTGIAPSALRYYERESLLASTDRAGLRRQYDPNVIDRLAIITLAREAGFSIAEIRTLLATDGEPAEWKPLVAAKVASLREHIDRLEAIQTGLEHSLKCKSPNALSCPTFRATLANGFKPCSPQVGSG